MEDLLTFPNQVFDSKSNNPILRYPTFSGSTTAKLPFSGKFKKI
jgi:hypothetical protein